MTWQLSVLSQHVSVSVSCVELSKVLRSNYKCVQTSRLVTVTKNCVWDAITLSRQSHWADIVFERNWMWQTKPDSGAMRRDGLLVYKKYYHHSLSPTLRSCVRLILYVCKFYSSRSWFHIFSSVYITIYCAKTLTWKKSRANKLKSGFLSKMFLI